MKYIDSHAHYLSGRFNKDRDKIINYLLNSDLECIVECGTNTISNKKVINLCNQYENIYGVIGYFPTDVFELKNSDNIDLLKTQLKNPKIIGVGEIGLDYYHNEENKEIQKKYFIKQLEIARELDLPVCIHSREAEKDTVAILKEFGKYKGVIHCYAYGIESMQELLKLGYSFGIGGTCTYQKNKELRNAIRKMPLRKILLETDAPYLSPDSVRRERNDSSNIKFVIEEIAKLKNVSKEEVIKVTNENVKLLYSKLKI